MNEAIKQWNQESAKTVKKSDILEYLAFSYYSQVSVDWKHLAIFASVNKMISGIPNFHYPF